MPLLTAFALTTLMLSELISDDEQVLVRTTPVIHTGFKGTVKSYILLYNFLFAYQCCMNPL